MGTLLSCVLGNSLELMLVVLCTRLLSSRYIHNTDCLISSGITWTGQCVQDTGSRLLPHKTANSNTNAPAECQKKCDALKYAFYGVQYASQCFCGNKAPPMSSLRPGECTRPCKGDATMNCGGSWRMNVFATGMKFNQSWLSTSTTKLQFKVRFR